MGNLSKKARRTKKPAVRVPRLLRLPPDIDAAIVQLAEEEGEYTHDIIIQLLREALTNRGRFLTT